MSRNALYSLIGLVMAVGIAMFVISSINSDPENAELITPSQQKSINTNQTSEPTSKATQTKTKSPTTVVAQPGTIKKFSTVSEALASGLSLRCPNLSGAVTNTFLIARSKVRLETADRNGTSYTVLTPTIIFYWRSGSSAVTTVSGAPAVIERNKIITTSLTGASCTVQTVPDSAFTH